MDSIAYVPTIKRLLWAPGDYARDGGVHTVENWKGHPGILSNRLWANVIAEDLKISIQ